jgi:hypothetical protein
MKEAIKDLQGKTFYTFQGGKAVKCEVCGKVPHPRATFTLLVSFPDGGNVAAMSWKRFLFTKGVDGMYPTKKDLYMACEEFYTGYADKFKALAIEEIAKGDVSNSKVE